MLLNKEQEAKIKDYKAKWVKIGLSTSESTDEDYELCFQAVKNMLEGYDCELLKYSVCDSPLEIYSKKRDGFNWCLFHSIHGSLESCWLYLYDFFANETDVELDSELFQPFITLAMHVSWCYINDGVVYFSRKPTAINIEENGLIHNENGPAIEYKDGFKIWAIDGCRVSEKIVMRPEQLSLKEIHEELNSDIQAVMVDRFGWEKYIKESDVSLIDSRENLVEGTLEALYETKYHGNRLVVTCPTGRVFTMGVPKNIKDCKSAQFWLSNDEKRQFNVIGRT